MKKKEKKMKLRTKNICLPNEPVSGLHCGMNIVIGEDSLDHLDILDGKIFIKDIDKKSIVLKFDCYIEIINSDPLYKDYSDTIIIRFGDEKRCFTSEEIKLFGNVGHTEGMVFCTDILMIRDDEVRQGFYIDSYSEANIYHDIVIKVSLKKKYCDLVPGYSYNY